MELNGKKIAFLGDSITQGVGTSDIDHVFWNVIARQTHAQCFGYGISGTRIAPQHKKMDDYVDVLDFGARVDTMIPDADVVVVFGGTNDYGHGDAPFGDLTDTDPATFCGAMHTLLKKLYERYPAAEIVVMTPLHRLGETDHTVNERGVRRTTDLEGYVNAMTRICQDFSTPVLDLFRVSGMQPAIPAIREMYMPDGLHPSDAGNARIASRLIAFLKAL